MITTQSAIEDTLSFEVLDQLLAQHPFGNSDYITEQLHVCYKRRLGKISIHLPVAGQLLRSLSQASRYCRYRVIGDTVVRCAVQHAHRQVEIDAEYGLPLVQCEELFLATIRLLEQGKCGPLGSGLVNRLGPEPYHGWIWSEDRTDDAFTRALKYVVYDNYDEHLCTPNTDELAMLVKGAQLLRELLPQSSRSALSHAHLIAIFPPIGNWTARGSSSEFRISGTIFLSRKLLSNAWWVAENLFHEALHQQMYDFRQGHSLLEATFASEEAPRVCSLWNEPDSNRWDTHRALAAFHVYVHIALLCSVAEQRAQELEDVYGKPGKLTGTRKALERAHYLSEQIRALCWQELGLAGKRFVDWFDSILDALDPAPPPEGSYVHLLLDRYQREVKGVEVRLRDTERHTDLSQQIASLAQDEINSARCVLAAANAEVDLRQFNDSLAHLSDEEPGTHFAQVRRLVSDAIRGISPDGYTLSESKVADETVKQMVERSSERLITLFAK